jgi:alanyl-tRNA synthetase
MKSNDIRSKFLQFFEQKNHEVLKSFPLIPQNDPSILWINAGMTPLKKYFKGEEVPNNPRLSSSQRCVRTNDIENVGRTPRHQTMFEMLGNFSIGDYFKHDAIHFAFDFLTNHLMLEKDRLYVTVYVDDSETFDIWTKEIGVSVDHLLKTKEDNFWDIGEGPCGPCSEIFYDTKPEIGKENWHPDNYDGTRYLEIWNLVFSEFNHNKDGSYTNLPKKNIDTGAGLERLSMILQGVSNNFETDLFTPIIKHLERISPKKYKESKDSIVCYHAISDHIRSIVIMIFDGEIPSNTERGYIIRRLIRRSMRFGKKLGHEKPFLSELVPTVVDLLKEVEPLIINEVDKISNIIDREEKRFEKVLIRGERMLNRKIKYLKDDGIHVLPGEFAFSLHDSNGFPIDITEEICQEQDITLDRETFDEYLQKQQEKSRKK